MKGSNDIIGGGPDIVAIYLRNGAR